MISSWDYHVITVCIDKRSHKEKYSVWRYDPYHYCLAMMLERYVFFLEKHNARGDALSESRGGKEDKRLKLAFARLWESGADYIDRERIQKALTSKELKVKLKRENIAGLQLADMLAHPSRNEILRDQGLLQRSVSPFAELIISILQTKYLQHNGRIYGWGKKFQ